jgi:arylsulfatase A-like enzyme
VVFRYVEGFYPSSSPQGTGHGSPYYYDRFVPLIFLGVGVESGSSMEPVRSVDIAPTLASLAGIEAPDDLDGRPLLK